MNLIVETLTKTIETPMKAAITTVTGLVTGYIPMTVNKIVDIPNSSIDTAFQHTVWTLTSIVALTAIISWIQKQRDRWIERHPNKNKNIYDDIEDED